MTGPLFPMSPPPPTTFAEAAERRADLMRQLDDLQERQDEERKHIIDVFAEARGYLPQPLRDYLLPAGADGLPADDCLFQRADLSKASEAERDARFRYRLAHEALDLQRGLAEAVRLLPPNRDAYNKYREDHDFELLMYLTDEIAAIDSLCVREPTSPSAPTDGSGVCVPAGPGASAPVDKGPGPQ